MCGRFTVKATWAELVALYRLTMDAPPHNLRPRYNVCPTDPVDVVTAEEGKRELITMRWGLVPWWWSKPLKELRMATFNARAETVETKPVFRDAFKRTRCLIPMSGITEPNDFAAEVHDRMPAFLTQDQFAPWLSGEAGTEYLKPAPTITFGAGRCRSGSIARRRMLTMRR